jgi:very-short-patch-repair endonuclease
MCEVEFRTTLSERQAVTCGSPECKRRYKREVASAKVAEAARRAYAEGTRKPARGISEREETLWPLLRGHGWRLRLRWTDETGSYELDFAQLEHRVNVEIDGPEHRHGHRPAKDAARDAELKRQGWRVVRIPNADVDANAERVAAQIHALVR